MRKFMSLKIVLFLMVSFNIALADPDVVAEGMNKLMKSDIKEVAKKNIIKVGNMNVTISVPNMASMATNKQFQQDYAEIIITLREFLEEENGTNKVQRLLDLVNRVGGSIAVGTSSAQNLHTISLEHIDNEFGTEFSKKLK